MRKILGAPSYLAVAGMRGEIGIGMMKSRIVRGRLQYVRAIEQGGKEILKRVWENMKDRGTGRWMAEVRKYLGWAELEIGSLGQISQGELSSRVAEVVDREWKVELEARSTLARYKRWKTDMRQEDCYDGRPTSQTWFMARTNCLRLRDRGRHQGQDVTCFMCGTEVEDLVHFVLDCAGLERWRIRAVDLQRPRLESEEEVLGRFLFGEEDVERKKEVLGEMWRQRGRVERARAEEERRRGEAGDGE